VNTLGGRRLDVGDDDMGAVEHVLAVGVRRHRKGQLSDSGAGLLVVLVVLALAPDEGIEPHHYDRRANHTATTRTGKRMDSSASSRFSTRSLLIEIPTYIKLMLSVKFA
jgi:hypothetical protein